jgi:predicted amidohydrolase YtcJ
MAMLYAYTRNAALAMNQLNKIGSIAPGKQADFVVVDRDVLTVPAEQLKGTRDPLDDLRRQYRFRVTPEVNI